MMSIYRVSEIEFAIVPFYLVSVRALIILRIDILSVYRAEITLVHRWKCILRYEILNKSVFLATNEVDA